MDNKLILRSQNSPYGDITKGSVLSHADVDNNFINLKGEAISTATTTTSGFTLTRINGETISVDLPYFTGNTPQYDQTVSVVATSPDNYIGVATPSITGYNTNTIYTVSFGSTNITSATTINIDSAGVLDLLVPTESGLVGPVPSGITTGITYFMIYDGNQMQLFDENPAPTNPLLYTNLAPIPTTIGGVIAGMTFSGATMQQMWDTLLYPYMNPSFGSFSIAGQAVSLEVGATLAGGSRTFNWTTSYSSSILPNTVRIKNINTNVIISTPASGMTNDGTEVISIASVTRTSAGSQSWGIYATTDKNLTISRTFVVTWYNRIYYGTSALTGLTASSLTGLTGTALTTSALRTYVFPGGGYKYICIPTALANPSLFKDASTNLTVAMAGPSDGYTILNNGNYVQQVVVTNAYGVNITYDVYRTKNTLGGAIDIIAS
jgi:hypothetical protein